MEILDIYSENNQEDEGLEKESIRWLLWIYIKMILQELSHIFKNTTCPRIVEFFNKYLYEKDYVNDLALGLYKSRGYCIFIE
ncbi:hypothetical protein HYD43_00845 [Mycoplasmopsis bovis]|nr:hypothetical protein [Mycoplasmopsis bovis]QQH83881.1 hypothetical protein HYD43_00845 [Mycoplasmopsis bovis]